MRAFVVEYPRACEKAESVRAETGVVDRAYQTQVINSHMLR